MTINQLLEILLEADRFEEDTEATPSSKHAAGEIVVDWTVKD